MVFFRGINSVNIDAKGRLALPKRYRESVSEACNNKIIVTTDPERPCLFIYPLHEWEILEQKIMDLPGSDSKVRDLQQVLVGHALDVDVDNQGRILISNELREHAQITKESYLVGQGKKFQLWSKQTWDENKKAMFDSASTGEVSQAIANLRI